MFHIMCKSYLQGGDSLEHVFPHTNLHVKLRQFLVRFRARRSDLFGRTDVLGEVKDMARC